MWSLPNGSGFYAGFLYRVDDQLNRRGKRVALV